MRQKISATACCALLSRNRANDFLQLCLVDKPTPVVPMAQSAGVIYSRDGKMPRSIRKLTPTPCNPQTPILDSAVGTSSK